MLTSMLSGDDLAKTVKDISETNRVGVKLDGNNSFKGGKSAKREAFLGQRKFAGTRQRQYQQNASYRNCSNNQTPTSNSGTGKEGGNFCPLFLFHLGKMGDTALSSNSNSSINLLSKDIWKCRFCNLPPIWWQEIVIWRQLTGRTHIIRPQ